MLKRVVLLFFLSIAIAFGQERCGSADKLLHQLEKNSKQYSFHQKIEKKIQKWSRNKELNSSINIPVVFHIVYKNSLENISDAQILSQLNILNQDFRRQNIDQINTPSDFSYLAADTEINFCLAQRTPNNEATNGITRTETIASSFSLFDDRIFYDSLGGKDIWDSDLYLNIYVCDLSSVLGFAAFPSSNKDIDGVVIDFENFGNTGTVSPPYNKGRTCTHEVGHWLNLIHIWGDMQCGDDLVSDTPVQESPNYGCPAHPSSTCINNGDMFQNYMDYTNDACMNMFTNGQKIRMQATLATARQNINFSKACQIPYEDIGITQVNSISNNTFCGSQLNIEVVMSNFSGDEIKSAIITYQLNNLPPVHYEWNGNLPAGGNINVNIGAESVQTGNNELSIYSSSPNGFHDLDFSNDTTKIVFDVIEGNAYDIGVFTDNYGDEVNWQITDQNNNEITSGNDLVSNSLNEFEICLELDSCYIFTIYDTYNDGICCDYGNGYFSINETIFSGNYSDSYSVNLCDLTNTFNFFTKKITVYPNPSLGIFVFLSNQKIHLIKVYDLNGKMIFNSTNNDQTIKIDLSSAKAGIYAAHITNFFGETSLHKLIIQ